MRFRRERAARRGRPAARPATDVQFTGEELVAVARFLAVGRVMLQEEYPPVSTRPWWRGSMPP